MVRKGFKVVALQLVAVLLIMTLIPTTAQAARPSKFNISRVRGLKREPVQLKIADMIFYGYKDVISDEELDALIDKIMKDMNITEDAFNIASEYQDNKTEEQDKLDRDASLKIAELLGLPGQAADVIKIIDNLRRGDYGGARTEFRDLMLKHVLVPYSQYSELRDWAKVIKAFNEIPENTFLYDFYGRLNYEIDKSNKVVVFRNAVATNQFQFMGTSMYETWILNMTLNWIKPQGDYYWTQTYTYSGEYTIDIEYDLSGLPDALMEIYEQSEGFAAAAGVALTVNLANNGIHTATRTLKGSAKFIGSASGFMEVGDTKNVDVSDIIIHYYGRNTVPCEVEFDLEFSADEQIFFVYLKNHSFIDLKNGTSFSVPDYDYGSSSWETWSDIWHRGDEAKRGWWRISMSL